MAEYNRSTSVVLLHLDRCRGSLVVTASTIHKPDSLGAQSQRRDVISTAEIINTACDETTQGFHLNATTCTRTGVSILLFFERKSTAKPHNINFLRKERRTGLAHSSHHTCLCHLFCLPSSHCIGEWNSSQTITCIDVIP